MGRRCLWNLWFGDMGMENGSLEDGYPQKKQKERKKKKALWKMGILINKNWKMHNSYLNALIVHA